MSDETFGTPLLYLPAAVSQSIACNDPLPRGTPFTLFVMLMGRPDSRFQLFFCTLCDLIFVCPAITGLPVANDDRDRDEKLHDNFAKLASVLRALIWFVQRKNCMLMGVFFFVLTLKFGYVFSSGEEPFAMVEAAEHLEKLAEGTVPRHGYMEIDRQG